MRVLVACEFSGIVRDAFVVRGHDAWSCDLLPSERPGNHIHDDVLKHLNEGWDLMVGHPPCTYLSYAGASVWNNPGRKELRDNAFDFFMKLINAPIEKIAIENPHGLPRVKYRQPDQEIHPWYFGDGEMKRTLLWLKNLPVLKYDKLKYEKPRPSFIRRDGNKQYFCSTTRDPHKRSKFWPGIAKAMAEQWGKL